MTKRTYPEYVKLSDDGQFTGGRKITCIVTGDMADGSKVWTDPETGYMYYAMRLLGNYYFVLMAKD